MTDEKIKEAIDLLKEVQGMVYDTMQPMPKADISSCLSKALALLNQEKEFEDMNDIEQLRYMIDNPFDFHQEDWIGDLQDLALKVCDRLEEAEAKCNDCVYLEVDGKILNENVEKFKAYDRQIERLTAKLEAAEAEIKRLKKKNKND